MKIKMMKLVNMVNRPSASLGAYLDNFTEFRRSRSDLPSEAIHRVPAQPERFTIRGGQAVITTLVFFLFVSTALLASFASIAFKETAASRIDVRAKQAYFLAEAGVEDLVWRIRSNRQYDANEMVSLDGTAATVSVTTSGTQKIVESSAAVSNAVRKVRSTLIAGWGASFLYGMQAGRGGLFVQNSSQINGSVYSNGGITGQNDARITGDAFAALTSDISGLPAIGGNARAHAITASSVTGSATSSAAISSSAISRNAYADTVSGSTVSGTLSYCTSQSGNTIGAPPAMQSCPAPADLAEIPMPVSEFQLDQLQVDAAAATTSAPCPYLPPDGAAIGPLTVGCDMTIDGTKVVTLTGTLWVQGNLALKNSAQLKLAASFCADAPMSGAVIVSHPSNQTTSSKVSVENSAQILGCGSNSYVMVVSRNRSAELGGGEAAIDIKNSSNAPIYYAPHGKILVQNSANLKGVTGYRLETKNSAVVTYESGLASVVFSTGPSGGWIVQNWNEIK